MEKQTNITDTLENIQKQLCEIHIILVDFTFLVHMHGKELLEWLTSFVALKQCKVLVCDEFFGNYELFQKSESPEQREIAAGANNFINMLSQKNALIQDDRFDTMEQLILKLQVKSDVALFLARNSEADEVLRSCSHPNITVVSCMADGSLFCSHAVDYLNETWQAFSRESDDLSTVFVPDFPELDDTVHTKDKVEYVLKQKINSGAEGTVYLTNNPSYVCKIYHPDNLTLEKVKKMSLLENRQVHYEGICWPEARVFSSKGYPVGYLMKKANGQSLSSIFDGEEAVKNNFTDMTRKDLVDVAVSVFEKIRYLHLMGILIGDVRPQNILIDQNADTYLIDLDSCQIGGYPSPVGDEDYTPLENQGKVFSDFLRTYRNERFSCAVLLFYLLFLGQHPYGQRNGADTIGEEIAAHSFRYPKDKNGDYSLIPYGCYKEIWKYTPRILSDSFFGVFKNDVRLSDYEWLQLMKEYSSFLDTLPSNDIRNHLSCTSGILFSEKPKPTVNQQNTPPRKKEACPNKRNLYKIPLIIILIVLIFLLFVYLISYAALVVNLGTTPGISEPFIELKNIIQNIFSNH
ncbi:MAG: hypothetical protein ACI4I3_01900 [Acutalibacteraceae bacterium]